MKYIISISLLVALALAMVAAGPNEPIDQARASQRNPLNINIPLFFDMLKTDSGMGINVLSGLVRVDRGQEASRNGLGGPRPLSVRIFGVPIFERGTRANGLTPEISRPPPIQPSGEPEAVPDNEVLTNP